MRKAYFKLAQKYHPDKNPEGRDMFEAVNKAYEFLCSKNKLVEGPDPQNIVLILQAQSILFKRYKEGKLHKGEYHYIVQKYVGVVNISYLNVLIICRLFKSSLWFSHSD